MDRPKNRSGSVSSKSGGGSSGTSGSTGSSGSGGSSSKSHAPLFGTSLIALGKSGSQSSQSKTSSPSTSDTESTKKASSGSSKSSTHGHGHISSKSGASVSGSIKGGGGTTSSSSSKPLGLGSKSSSISGSSSKSSKLMVLGGTSSSSSSASTDRKREPPSTSSTAGPGPPPPKRIRTQSSSSSSSTPVTPDDLANLFGTITPDPNLLQGFETGLPTAPTSSLNAELDSLFQDELGAVFDEHKERFQDDLESSLKSEVGRNALEMSIVSFLKDYIHKKSPELPKNLLKTLGACCGLSGVRGFIITRIEQWLHNHKICKNAQELLMYLCVNSKSETQADAEQVIKITKLRMKTKQLTQLYATAIREMVRYDTANLTNVLHQVIYNELSLQKNPSNSAVLGAIIPSSPEAKFTLAEIFMDLLQRREDFQVSLRLILKEIVRGCRNECNLALFIQGLLRSRELGWKEGDFRERAFNVIVNFVVFCNFLSFSPAVKEASVSRNEKNAGILSNFYSQIIKMQEEALTWLYKDAFKLYHPQKKDYVQALYKIVLKDPASDLLYKEGWPPEPDRNMFARHCLELPLHEPTLKWVIFQAFSEEHSFFSGTEILDLVEYMIMKAAQHSGTIELSKSEIIDFLFQLSEYRYPDNYKLPQGYLPPKLAITKSYWKVWLLLTVIAAFNPTTLGKVGWDSLPTLKGFMEMCMTNQFSFPTVTSSETLLEITSREHQTSALEKEQILELESHLAAVTKTVITERNSRLLQQVMCMDPKGPSRTPPSAVLLQLKAFNDSLKLGHRLCRSRNPDFLVDLMQRNSEPMPWLSELVYEGSFEILPVRSLCEFMLGQTDRLLRIVTNEIDGMGMDLGSSGDKSPKKGQKSHSHSQDIAKEDAKTVQLLHYLQDGVQGTSPEIAVEIVEFFFKRLSAPKNHSRLQAIQGLQLLFSTPKKPLDDTWLLEIIPNLPLFSALRSSLTASLREAVQVENEPKWLVRYLEFLSLWGNVENDTIIDNLALDVTQLVVERSIVIQTLLAHYPEAYEYLFTIYLEYMKLVREPRKDSHQWSQHPEQVLVEWEGLGLEANTIILIIHAIVILLSSYSSDRGKSSSGSGGSTTDQKYNDLLDMWFPKNPEYKPKGLFLNTTEEAVLFPDWIKLRMIRSNNSRLLSAASDDLDIEQLVLFVQSFGIPLQSMTGLLYCLDKAAQESPEKVKEVIVDPKYMSTLIDLQWQRGAKGGEIFAGLLQTLVPPEPPELSKLKIDETYNPRPILLIPGLDKIPTQNKNKPLLKNKVQMKIQMKDSASASQSQMDEKMDSSTTEELDIRILSKQLLTLSSAPSAPPKRRSSIPMFEDSPHPTASLRRHSIHHHDLLGVEMDVDSDENDKTNTLGHLIDTFRDVEPSIIRNALDIQLPLLFGRNENPPHCRAFLLTTLTHESGWDTVEQCLKLFLTEFVPSYDPSAVLDLISSTISNPKLWQGCDKFVPRHQPRHSVFHLTEQQLLVMAEYIVEELSQIEMKKNTNFSISSLLGPSSSTTTALSIPKTIKKTKQCLQERIKLWLKCCQHNKTTVDTVMSLLMKQKYLSRNPCTKKMLSQIYHEFPQVILQETWDKSTAPTPTTTGISEDSIPNSSILDSITHILLNAVSNTQPGKIWAKKVTHEFELCLRKIASVHPTILLRQLPMIEVLLEGRVFLEHDVFHGQNHHIPFKVFLGLIELMQPHVLKEFKVLIQILKLYTTLFQNFGHLKDYTQSLSRYAVLLHNLLPLYPAEMKEFLTENYTTLKDLSTESYYSELSPLQNLLNSIIPPSSSSELSIVTVTLNEIDMNNTNSVQTQEILERFQHASNNDEMASVLQELESIATRNPTILNQCSEYLNPLLLSEHETCRSLAYVLMLKHMTYSPVANKLYIKSVMEALQNQGFRNIDSLIERLPEFVVLAQENAEDVLKQMFELGLSSTTSMLPAIIKTLQLLRSQTGI